MRSSAAAAAIRSKSAQERLATIVEGSGLLPETQAKGGPDSRRRLVWHALNHGGDPVCGKDWCTIDLPTRRLATHPVASLCDQCVARVPAWDLADRVSLANQLLEAR